MSRLHLRLVLVFLLVMVTVGTLSAVLVMVTRPERLTQLRAGIEGRAQGLAEDVAQRWDDPAALIRWMEQRAQALRLLMTLRDAEGHLIHSVGRPLLPDDRPSVRLRGRQWRHTLAVHVPVKREGETLGMLTVAPGPMWEPPGPRPSVYPGLWLVAALVVAAVLLWPISRGLTRRLVALESVSMRLAQGDLTARARVRGNDEIDRLARRFNAMADALQAQRDGRRRFFQAISHELRSPLARLRLALDVLRESPDETERQRCLANAERDVQELDALVGNLLDVARGSDGRPPLQPCSVDVVALARSLAEPLGLSLIAEQPYIRVTADPQVLGRAIRNVLENAAHCAPPDQPVELSVHRANGQMELRFRDHGPGIEEAELERIFEPFYRPDTARDRTSGGVGLGLALVRQAMEQHGGTARAENHPEGGAVLVLSLPDNSSPQT